MSGCCKCSLRFNGKHFTGSFKNCKLQVGDIVVQQGRDNMITKLEDKQDGAIVTTFRNGNVWGVHVKFDYVFVGWV